MKINERTEASRLASTPMNIDVGRLNARDIVQLSGCTIAALAIGCLGGWLCWLALPEYGTIDGWRAALSLFGASIGVVGCGVALIVAHLTIRDWTAYHRRLDDWHYAALEAFEDAHGKEQIVHTTSIELQSTVPRDILLAALVTTWRANQMVEHPHSVNNLTGEHWLGNQQSDIRIGNIGRSQAAKFNRLFVKMGLIERTVQGTAGHWVPATIDETISRVIQNWSRR